jgi:PKD repeat protein
VIAPGDPVNVTATLDDTRFSNANGTEPTQAVAGAEAYIDVPPWQPGAVALPLTAADGAFNSSTEGLTGSIDTTGLSLGRHIVYVRARDAGGTWGAVSASFLNVTNSPPPLAANFTASCSNLTCSFNASGSTGGVTSYTWAFGDGASASGVTASRTYAAAGSYNVTLTVGNGTATASQVQTVSVTAPAVTTVTEAENNNTLGRAQLISPNPALVNGIIGSNSDVDYYRVSLAAGKTLSATLTPNSTSNYNLDVYNASGTLLARSTNGTGLVDTVTSLNSGTAAVTRYVRVNRASGGTGSTNGRYTLRLAQ